jgi:hypothetical protein
MAWSRALLLALLAVLLVAAAARPVWALRRASRRHSEPFVDASAGAPTQPRCPSGYAATTGDSGASLCALPAGGEGGYPGAPAQCALGAGADDGTPRCTAVLAAQRQAKAAAVCPPSLPHYVAPASATGTGACCASAPLAGACRAGDATCTEPRGAPVDVSTAAGLAAYMRGLATDAAAYAGRCDVRKLREAAACPPGTELGADGVSGATPGAPLSGARCIAPGLWALMGPTARAEAGSAAAGGMQPCA